MKTTEDFNRTREVSEDLDFMKAYDLQGDMELGDASLSEDEMTRILRKTMDQYAKATTKAKRKRKKIRPFLVACILILAMFTISFAAYQYIASQNALGFFSSKNQKQAQTLNSLGMAIDKQVSQNGLTIDIKEVIGDRHTALILFDVIAPKDMALNQNQYCFEQNNIRFAFSTSMGWYLNQLEDKNPKDHRISMALCLDSRSKLVGKKVTLEFENFSYYNPNSTGGDDIYCTVVPGKWQISFDLNYKDGSVRYPVHQAISSKLGKTVIKEVILSPISISIKLVGDEIREFDNNPPSEENSLPYDDEILIHLKNGETFQSISSSGTSTSGNTMVLNYSFSEILELSQIAFLEVGGTKVILEKH